MGTSASPRPHQVRPRPRDARASPNPPDVWHSRELHVGAGWSKVTSDSMDGTPSPAPSSVKESSREPAPASENSSSPASSRSPPMPTPSQTQGPIRPSQTPRPGPELDSRARSKSREVRPPGHAGKCSSPATAGAPPTQTSRGKELHLPRYPRLRDLPAWPATGTPAAGILSYLLSPPSLQLPLSRRHHCHRDGECSASYSSASWDARCRLNSELSEDQPMELHFLLVRLCGGRLRGEFSTNRGEKRRG